jgi:hypothetical protein
MSEGADSKINYSPVLSETDVQSIEHPEKPTSYDMEYFKHNIQPRLFTLSFMIAQRRPERELYNFLGLTEEKYYLYKRWFPELRNAVVQGKTAYIEIAENSLFKVGVGMEYEESEIVNVYAPGEVDPVTGKSEMVLVQKQEKLKKKYNPPNVRALEMFLTNKNPENWKRNQPDNLTQNNTATVINVTGDQVKDLISQMQSAFMVDTNTTLSDIKDAEVVDEGL